MNRDWSISDDALGNGIRLMGDSAVRGRDATEVVRTILAAAPKRRLAWARPRLLKVGGTLALVAILAMTALRLSGSESASRMATAQVRGLTYALSVVRNLDLSGARLTPLADADQDGGFRTIGRTAYQLDVIDPDRILVMKLVPGQTDDGGSIGQYLLLVRGDGFELVCPYFSSNDDLRPTICN